MKYSENNKMTSTISHIVSPHSPRFLQSQPSLGSAISQPVLFFPEPQQQREDGRRRREEEENKHHIGGSEEEEEEEEGKIGRAHRPASPAPSSKTS